MGIAKHITRELERRNWSQRRLAAESGLDQRAISDMISADRNPQINTIAKIANGFGITIDEFVMNPKPVPKIRGKPKPTAKAVQQYLVDFGLELDDAEEVLAFAKMKIERRKAKGRATV